MAAVTQSRGQRPKSARSPLGSADPTAQVLRLRPRTSSRDRRRAGSADGPWSPVTRRRGRGGGEASGECRLRLRGVCPRFFRPRSAGLLRSFLALAGAGGSPPCRATIAPSLTSRNASSKGQRGGAKPRHSPLCTLLYPRFLELSWGLSYVRGRWGKLSPGAGRRLAGKREGVWPGEAVFRL